MTGRAISSSGGSTAPRSARSSTAPAASSGSSTCPTGAARTISRPGSSVTMGDLPPEARRTLTWDQGSEMACHDQLAELFADGVFFAYPGRPWERRSTRTPTASCASTSRSAPTSPSTPRQTSAPSSDGSTNVHARCSAGAHPPRSSPPAYAPRTPECCDDRSNPPRSKSDPSRRVHDWLWFGRRWCLEHKLVSPLLRAVPRGKRCDGGWRPGC